MVPPGTVLPTSQYLTVVGFLHSTHREQDILSYTHLAGLCQAHANAETGRHARRQAVAEACPHRRIDDPEASHHRLHNQLCGELADTLDFIWDVPGEERWGVEGAGAAILEGHPKVLMLLHLEGLHFSTC